MKTLACLFVILTVFALSNIGQAADIPEALIKQKFNDFDCNHDGSLSLEEGIALGEAVKLNKDFSTLEFNHSDKNKDGKISYEEFKEAVIESCGDICAKNKSLILSLEPCKK